ncbi:MAG: preQ(1) synthase [Candidatus Electryonea clarkiae]|nr:preQ(1) synthase [Candidatus Electryonea clarkiae]MDP8285130.1 preQ(1) synthase [Candidatus Electryonea clarkiae]
MPTSKEDLKHLTLLGSKVKSTDKIEVFPNHAPGKMEVTIHCNEFTCRCPMTGQPDFATIDITYTPGKWLAESKSVKLFLERYREEGVFHEHFAVELGEAFVSFVKPIQLEVVVHFNVRGGIAVDAAYHYEKNSSAQG